RRRKPMRRSSPIYPTSLAFRACSCGASTRTSPTLPRSPLGAFLLGTRALRACFGMPLMPATGATDPGAATGALAGARLDEPGTAGRSTGSSPDDGAGDDARQLA